MKIFLLEDDYSLHMAIKESIELDNHSVESFYDGLEAYDAINPEYGLFILDINVPNLDGIELLKHIKETNPKANVIMISANIDINTLEKAYTSGCDDYLKKPFEIAELILKIKRLDIIEDITINSKFRYLINEQKLLHNNEEVSLTKQEVKLLHILVLNANQVVTKELISENIYDDEIPLDASLRSLLRRLRQKLPEGCIETINGRGYKLHIS